MSYPATIKELVDENAKLRKENERLRKVIVDHLAPSAKAALANLHSITIY